jgi:hypothetical protein
VQPFGSSQHFMEDEGSLPRSQELSTCTYPEPDQSSPQHPILSRKRATLMLSIHLRLGLPSGLFPSAYSINNLYTFLFSPTLAICAAPLVFLKLRGSYSARELYRLSDRHCLAKFSANFCVRRGAAWSARRIPYGR